MAARTKYRKRALDILFESELQDLPLGGTLPARLETNDPPVNEYSIRLVRGVAEHQETIDRMLADHAHGWTLARMPGVDRNLLRIAAYEILYIAEVPNAVAASEAVELATELSTDESPAFISGVLSAIVRQSEATA